MKSTITPNNYEKLGLEVIGDTIDIVKPGNTKEEVLAQLTAINEFYRKLSRENNGE